MKKSLILFSVLFFIVLSSFKRDRNEKVLPNGHYLVQLDKKYSEQGLNDYEFILEDRKFIHKLKDKIDDFQIDWVDENSFKVKGLTEPLNPIEREKELLENNTIYFRIIKIESNNYHFILGEEFDKYPVYSGKFIKIK
ncbi:hypothetical protein ACI6PS_00365 [Flavobacterium sp. PLA-1-15]|uniref:hypothetical protein n=1 Tax=Flavobacterium sp. PLA-1-15 TaxID=3380533 RepID=UPI003B7ABE9B